MEGFKRSQVEWALWRFFIHGKGVTDDPPPVFRTRIKRLLEIDRRDSRGDTGFAFSEVAPEGRGISVQFTALDAFNLALGLDLLDVGFKQGEVVFLLRHLRRSLKTEYERIMASAPDFRSDVRAEDAPNVPSYQDGSVRVADFRVFLTMERIEIKEAFPTAARRADPLIINPRTFRGIEQLSDELHRMNHDFRKVAVLELAETASLITDYLKRAPA